MSMRPVALAALLLMQNGTAYAICPPSPPVEVEAQASDAIVLARVKTQRLSLAPHDRSGPEEVRYELAIVQLLKGNVPKQIDIRSLNTSADFAMDAGKTYLLFLTKHPTGYRVNHCGNSTGPFSGMLSQGLAKLREAGYPRIKP